MILLLGGTGYIGEAFEKVLTERGYPFTILSRKSLDYTKFNRLLEFLKQNRPEFVINAAGFTGRPNVDACESAWADTLLGNTLFPQAFAHACDCAGIPWGHVSSGCIYSGAKLVRNGKIETVKNLTHPDIKQFIAANPGSVRGFTETDTPNFSFRDKPCSFYSGTKALAEEALEGLNGGYIWRLRIPFDEFDNSRNYLSKIQRYKKVYENANSISHRIDFANACLDLHANHAPFGTYNMTNPGWITTAEVVDMIKSILKPDRDFEFWADDVEFYKVAAKTPRSNCILDTSKLLDTGVKIRNVRDALEASLKNWKSEQT